MKNFILCIAMFICGLNAISQINTVATNELQALTISDSISTFARDFKLSFKGYVKDSTLYQITYTCVTDTTNKLYVVFNRQLKGNNKYLEIKGTPELKLRRIISSKYLDLFPLWKSRIDKNADVEKCVKAYNLKQVNGVRYYFKKSSEWWEITVI